MGSAGVFIHQSAGGCISQPTVLELCFGPFFSFPVQAVEYFYQVLLLDIFTVGLSFFLMLGKFACSWPFWPHFRGVFLSSTSLEHPFSGPKSFPLW